MALCTVCLTSCSLPAAALTVTHLTLLEKVPALHGVQRTWLSVIPLAGCAFWREREDTRTGHRWYRGTFSELRIREQLHQVQYAKVGEHQLRYITNEENDAIPMVRRSFCSPFFLLQ